MGGIRSRVSIALIDAVAVGDYVIVHAGFAITRLDVEEAEKCLALFDEIAAHLGKCRPMRYVRGFREGAAAAALAALHRSGGRPAARLSLDGILRRSYPRHLSLRRRGSAARQHSPGSRPRLPGVRTGGAAPRCRHRSGPATRCHPGELRRHVARAGIAAAESPQGAGAGGRCAHGLLGTRVPRDCRGESRSAGGVLCDRLRDHDARDRARHPRSAAPRRSRTSASIAIMW